MSASPHVVDVDQDQFQQAVIEKSKEVPVVVDFWAPWCGPCRVLGPVLEKLAERDDGRWVLAKVNTQDNQQIAVDYRVQGIPNVKAFVDGEVVDEFTGALPEYAVDQWLGKLVPSADDLEIEEAIQAEQAGDLATAEAVYQAIYDKDSEHAGAIGGLARLAIARDDLDAAAGIIESTPDHLWGSTDGALEQAWIAVEAAHHEAVDGDDLEAVYGRAMQHANAEAWDEALELLLSIVARDRTWRDDLGRIAMVRLFEVIGSDTDYVNEWRGKMGSVMYV